MSKEPLTVVGMLKRSEMAHRFEEDPAVVGVVLFVRNVPDDSYKAIAATADEVYTFFNELGDHELTPFIMTIGP